MPTDETDNEIVALLTDHQVAIQLYVRSLMPGDPAAQDVTQQANRTLWSKRSEFEVGTNFKAWAFSIARFEVLNYRKKQARDSRLIFSGDLEETIAAELPESSRDLTDRHTALKHCLEVLRPKDRELVLHRYFHRTRLADYASEVGRSTGALKVSLHRIRNHLQKCIEGQLARTSLPR